MIFKGDVLATAPSAAREVLAPWLPDVGEFYTLEMRFDELAVIHARATTPAGDRVWSMVYLFKVAGQWVVSAAVQNGDVSEVFGKLAVRFRP